MTHEGEFDAEELRSISSGLQEFEAGQVAFAYPTHLIDRLRQLWQPDWIPPAYKLREPDWYLGMTREFIKAVQDMDRKLQGRILSAISVIISRPAVPKGNTVKPLTGDLKGLWRYRIGDYRLVYRVDRQDRRVVLISFTSRGDAYA